MRYSTSTYDERYSLRWSHPDSPNTVSGDDSIKINDAFYRKLIDETLSWRDTLTCIGTVGANLTQNFFFLIQIIDSLPLNNKSSTLGLKIAACSIDFFASGTQNIYQRFWKSVMWEWTTRLPLPTQYFIKATYEYIKTKRKEEKKQKKSPQKNQDVIVLINKIYLAEFEKPNRKSLLHGLSPLFNGPTPTLDNALELIGTLYNVQITKLESIESTDLESNEKNKTTWYFNYSPEKSTTLTNYSFEEPPLNLSRYIYETLFWREATYWKYIYENHPWGLIKEKLNPLNLFCYIFLKFIPYLMMCFQTVSMLSSIAAANSSLWVANLVCISGILFGYGKASVNNRLRWEMAKNNLYSMITTQYYADTFRFFYNKIFLTLVNGISKIFSGNLQEGICYILAGFVRFISIFIGISVTLFYLDVGLYTKSGIQFTLNVIISDCRGDSAPSINRYENSHGIVDLFCAIASLSFNGALTQMPEAIKKCSYIAEKIEMWSSEQSNNSTEKPQHNSPLLIHTAIFFDIIVFGLSAWKAVQDLLDIAAGEKHQYENLRAAARFLNDYVHYAIIAGILTGVSNLIFTYSAAAPDQMAAWSAFKDKSKAYFFSTPPHSTRSNTATDTSSSTIHNRLLPENNEHDGSVGTDLDEQGHIPLSKLSK